jgi:hypothetical protein
MKRALAASAWLLPDLLLAGVRGETAGDATTRYLRVTVVKSPPLKGSQRPAKPPSAGSNPAGTSIRTPRSRGVFSRDPFGAETAANTRAAAACLSLSSTCEQW